jgi:hypothetical protein
VVQDGRKQIEANLILDSYKAVVSPSPSGLTHTCVTNEDYFSIGGDIPVNSETLVMTSSISRPNMPALSFMKLMSALEQTLYQTLDRQVP